MSQLGLTAQINQCSSLNVIIAYTTTQTQVMNSTLNITSFAKAPAIGTYILCTCGTLAHRVEGYADAEACGQRVKVMYVSEPILVSKTNNHGSKGVEIEMHIRKCDSQVVDIYFLSREKGFSINATLTIK